MYTLSRMSRDHIRHTALQPAVQRYWGVWGAVAGAALARKARLLARAPAQAAWSLLSSTSWDTQILSPGAVSRPTDNKHRQSRLRAVTGVHGPAFCRATQAGGARPDHQRLQKGPGGARGPRPPGTADLVRHRAAGTHNQQDAQKPLSAVTGVYAGAVYATATGPTAAPRAAAPGPVQSHPSHTGS